MKKYAYIPIEIKSREFIAKIILSLKLASKGYYVIIGKSTEVEKLCIFGSKGIYLGTSIMKQHNEVFERIIKSGSKVIAADEEGLVYYNEEDFKKNKIYYSSLENLNSFIAWGDHHKELIAQKYPEMTEKVKSIGNIRMEILKPRYRYLYKKEVDEIRNKYGEFILFNTNFGAYNNYIDSKNYLDIARDLVGEDKKDEIFRKDKINHQHITFEAFKELAIEIRKSLPSISVVIRPHPAESVTRWKAELQGTDIKIVREGNVLPWILASQCVIQQNCTTAIETFCLGKPVFSYLPVIDKRFDDGLPNKIAPVFEKKKDILESIKMIIGDESKFKEICKSYCRDDLNEYISGLNMENNIYDDYIRIFDDINISEGRECRVNFWRVKYKLYNWISMIVNKRKKELKKYISQKYPHTDFEKWRELIDLIDKSSDEKYSMLKYEKLTNDAYLISM